MSLIHAGCKIKANICTAIFYCYWWRTANPHITTESRDIWKSALAKALQCKELDSPTLQYVCLGKTVSPCLHDPDETSIKAFEAYACMQEGMQCCSTPPWYKKWKKGAELQKAWRVLWLLYITTMARAVFGHRQSRHCQASAISKQALLPFWHFNIVSAKALESQIRTWCWGWDSTTTARWGGPIYLQWWPTLTVPLTVVRTRNQSFQYSSQLLLHFLSWELASSWPPILWLATLSSACVI